MTGAKIAAGLLGLATLADLATAEEISLSTNLMPLFARSCAGCHQRENGNPDAIKHEIYFEKEKDVLKGVGSLIVPGKPDDSYLVQILKKPGEKPEWMKTMPPAGSKAPQMSEEEIKKISDWIKAGAKEN